VPCLPRNRYRPIWGVNAVGKPAEIRDFDVRRFEDGKVAEIATIQDQFVRLRQIGYLPGGSIRRTSAERSVTSQVVRMSQVAAGPGRDPVRLPAGPAQRAGWRYLSARAVVSMNCGPF
jgi:hypothetical protein